MKNINDYIFNIDNLDKGLVVLSSASNFDADIVNVYLDGVKIDTLRLGWIDRLSNYISEHGNFNFVKLWTDEELIDKDSFLNLDIKNLSLQKFKDNQFEGAFRSLIKSGNSFDKSFKYMHIIFLLETNTAEAFPHSGSFLKTIDEKYLDELLFLRKSLKNTNEYIIKLSEIIQKKLYGSKIDDNERSFFYELNLGVSKEMFYRGLKLTR